jgi:hypothetical protein
MVSEAKECGARHIGLRGQEALADQLWEKRCILMYMNFQNIKACSKIGESLLKLHRDTAKPIGWSITSIGKKSAVTAKVLELKTINVTPTRLCFGQRKPVR